MLTYYTCSLTLLAANEDASRELRFFIHGYVNQYSTNIRMCVAHALKSPLDRHAEDGTPLLTPRTSPHLLRTPVFGIRCAHKSQLTNLIGIFS